MATHTAGQGSPVSEFADLVELRVPADPAYVSVVRLAAAGLAARAELTVDDVEDVRLAVDEACALVLAQADRSATLDVRFEIESGCLATTVGAAAPPGAQIDREGFTWTVLNALASSVDVEHADGQLRVVLTRRLGAAR